jgi:hypothetical protein
MRFARLAEVAFCLLASPGVLVAQVASPEQAENSRREAKAEQAMNVSTAVPEEVESPHAVRVAQLSELVEASKGKSDEDAAKEIEHLELTERLSSPELARLSGELPGAQSKVALMTLIQERFCVSYCNRIRSWGFVPLSMPTLCSSTELS